MSTRSLDIGSLQLTKVPALPAGGMKRRMPDSPSPEMLKKMKMNASIALASSSATPEEKHPVTVEDVEDAEEDHNVDTRGDFAPGGDADYFLEEDDEGRFFGSGLTTEQKEILNLFDGADGEGIRDDVSRPI